VADRRSAVIELAASTFRDRGRLLALSEPASWPVAAIPFALAGFEAERAVTLAMVLGTLYFTAPFALLRNGMAEPDPSGTTRAAIAITNLPILFVLVLAGGAGIGIVLLLTIALAFADTLEPLHLHDRVGADLIAAGGLLALPAACGLALGAGAVMGTGAAMDGGVGATAPDHPWAAVVALAVWGTATAALAAIRTHRAAGSRSVIGDRGLAVIALIGYLATTAISVTTSEPGWLAAIALAAFVLLPLEVLLAPAVEATFRAHTAWSDLGGLVRLVGAWLIVLLVLRWAGAEPVAWAVAIAIPTILLGYILANLVMTRVATRRRRVPIGHGPGDDETLTIVVPADDGAIGLTATLVSARAQTYPGAVTVAMTSSESAGDEAAVWLGDEAVHDVPLPPFGAAGTAWSWHVGVGAADTDLALLVAPGVELSPIAARVLVEQLVAGGHDLLIGIARDAMPTVSERVAVPGFALWHIGLRPLWWAALTGGRPAALATDVGPLLLVRRESYLGLGEEAVRAATGAEPSLEHAFAAAGLRVGIVHSARLASQRYDPAFGSTVSAWRREVPLVGGALAQALSTILLMAIAYLVPLALPLIAILDGAEPGLVGAALIPLITLVLARIMLAVTQRQPLASIIWHPATIVIALAGLLGGVGDHIRGHRKS